jgi:hypothetical protein
MGVAGSRRAAPPDLNLYAGPRLLYHASFLAAPRAAQSGNALPRIASAAAMET